ncbi:MAG: ArsI/CadI family heavy metal resistance metalloenzyme [Acidimicrobiales bacterium]|nr:ArsI/CadI family heavy metal resistance metalloenzyme [Acidimicrobiales bacterium]
MSRVQLALNVADVDTAVDFYSKLFGTEPHKRRDGYANFEIAEPPLKLVLIQNESADSGSLNHLGVEVDSTDDVTAATRRLADQGMDTDVEDQVDCCFAVQDKVWIDGADGTRWEIYTITDDGGASVPSAVSACCAS